MTANRGVRHATCGGTVIGGRSVRALLFAAWGVLAPPLHATLQEPALRATRGMSCAAPLPSRIPMSAEERAAAQQRVERQLGTAYDRDGEVARRVAAALKSDAKLADTAIWVEARRQFVTLKGCVRKLEQRAAAESLTRRTMGVLRVGNELRVVAGAAPALPPPGRSPPRDDIE